MSLTTKQREALQALADVMQEHEIVFGHMDSYRYFNISIGDSTFTIYQGLGNIEASDITKLLQEQE